MKPLVYLSLFALLVTSSCSQDTQEPAVKVPAPPPTILISNTAGSGTPTITSSLSAATITVDSPNEVGLVTYYNTSGCVRASFEAVTVGSPLVSKITARPCPETNTNTSPVTIIPTSTVQTYHVGHLDLVGGALQIMLQANSNGNYASVQIRNIYWY